MSVWVMLVFPSKIAIREIEDGETNSRIDFER